MMATQFTSFDAATASLQKGVNVVEASAGTGKTYSLAMLVLRFVIEQNVAVEELLVVTYTRAATEELRGRIRARLVEAKEVLLHSATDDIDPGLIQYLGNLSDKSTALNRLELALLDMDRAPVFTIHGFCQRMLQEQALESGQLFDMELCADVSQVRQELVDDFWRRKMYDLDPLHCSLLLESFTDPQSLYDSIQTIGAEDLIEPACRVSLEDALQLVDEKFILVQRWWKNINATLEELFLDAIAQKMFKKKLLVGFVSWWQQCNDFFSGKTTRLTHDLSWLGRDGLFAELNGTKLRGDAKKEAFLQEWPLAEKSLAEFLVTCSQAVLSLRVELALELQEGLQTRLQKQGVFSFDDLILQLARALEGPQQEVLRQVLAKRFRVALIDEFQDTDAAQYRIFSTLFGGGEHYLFLIGDPKQAIYKFRGADIYAYFEARRSADNCLTLAKNYRSSPLLVEAVNDMFLQREESFVNPDLPYNRVDAAKSHETLRLLDNGTPEPAMLYCSLESPDENGVKAWSSGNCLARLQTFVLAEIKDLLQHKTMVQADEKQRALAAGDIAILVRSHKQAEAFQQTLAHGNIPSVVSSRKTVFETRECLDLQNVLEAVAVPSDASLLRRALSCRWFGSDGPHFYALIHDEGQMEGWLERFYAYHQLWKEQGLLAMMNSLISNESVFETLSALPLAQRQIANINHLLEILQEEETENNLVPSRILQYLARQRESSNGAEHAQLRLESDEEAVKIVTMHGVKGLEFPVVFCPVLWGRSARLKHEKQCIRFHDEQNRQVADLGSSSFAERRKGALQEELAEELRLLYVAVTRGSCRTYVCWADVKANGWAMSSRDSALAWALSLTGYENIVEQNKQIKTLCDGDAAAFRLLSAGATCDSSLATASGEQQPYSCRQFNRFPLTADWLMTSYSALAGSVHHSTGIDNPKHPNKNPVPIHELPFGAAFGNVVHGVLEDYPFSMLAGDAGYEDAVEGQCRRFGVVADAEHLMALLRDVTRAPLTAGVSGHSFSLADLPEEDLLKEMPFYFHLRQESTRRINALLSFSDVVRPVQEKTLKGYLTGFVDLVCRYRGKYYVIDYKSNYLGGHLHDYSEEKIRAAMGDHNYGLQYWIYTLVLHRFLEGTLQNYSYEETFGGVFYLFARGMNSKYPGNGVFFDRPQLSILEALLQTLGGTDGK
jgi:exodeoxyribonuclease V beta subunit